MLELRDRFVELPLRTSGVYALALQGEVVYIGKSLNVLSRVSQHQYAMRRRRNGKPESLYWERLVIFDRAFVRWAAKDDLDALEREMIDKYKPALNVRLRYRYRSTVNFAVLGKHMERWKSHSPESSKGFERRF